MDVAELKGLFEEQFRAFEAFKEENDRVSGRNEETLERLGGRLDEIETALSRAGRGPAEGAGESPDGAADGAPGEGSATPEARAYFAYLRHGTRDEPNPQRKALGRDEMKALSVGNDPAAGYLAPPEFAREIIKGEVEFSPLRAWARVRETSRNALQIPRRTGTFGAVWVAEQATRSETEGLTYGLEDIPTHEMYALVDVSQQMLEDSEFDLEAELRMEFAEQFAVTEGAGFVDGTGVGQPEGLLTNANVSTVNSGSAATIADANGQADGLVSLWHAVKTGYAIRGVWLLNRSTLAAVRKLKDDQGQYIWQPGLAVGQPNTILGSPYAELPDMPGEAANATPIAFGDLKRAYTVVDRIQLSVLRDPFTQATAGKIRFIARRRVGGQVVLPEAVAKLKCST
jgi:HK97 family phage major capsid protein